VKYGAHLLGYNCGSKHVTTTGGKCFKLQA
jgi:hypothetical protein